MRTLLLIPFKIIALPVMLALTLVAAFLHFMRAIGETLLLYVAVIFALLGIVTLFTASGNAYMIRSGIAGLVFGFLLSPYGLPTLAGLLIELLDSINDSLRGFLVS